MSFAAYRSRAAPQIEAALHDVLPPSDVVPRRLHEAMRYSVFAGGKRVRPLLALSLGEGLGAGREELLRPAAALELIHTFSLVHDDLPALDDDDLRRGQPTVHRRYGEALAILVGDALLSRGLEVLAEHPAAGESEVRLQNVADVARAVGSRGMVGGQVEDLEAEGEWPRGDRDAAAGLLNRIHERKTGALIEASLRVGARIAGADVDALGEVTRLGHAIGLLFQIRDDLLDLEQTAEVLGKTPGKDVAAGKLTYPALFGAEHALQLQQETYEEALRCEQGLHLGVDALRGLVEYLGTRTS